MTATLVLTNDFYETSLSLQDVMRQISADIEALHVSSREVYARVKQDLYTSWKKAPEVLEKYRLLIQDMPKELRERKIIKETILDIDKLEIDIRKYLSDLKETSYQKFSHTLETGINHIALRTRKLQSSINAIIDAIADLEENSVVNKFLKGETVLSCTTNIQWLRKLTHAFLGSFFLYVFVYSGWSPWLIWTLAGLLIAFAVSLETSRHLNPAVNQWVWKTFRPIMREREKTRINSAVLYIFSMAVVYFCFPVNVTVLTMLLIAIGDPVASIVGIKWGRTKIINGVSLEGSLACLIVCSLLVFIFVRFVFQSEVALPSLVLFSLIAGLIGAASEASFKKLDDNLVMPLVSAPALWGLMEIFSLC